jgi:hypothetical protein
MKREKVRDEVIKAIAGTKDLTESIDAIMGMEATHGVIESCFRYSSYQPQWYRGSEDECFSVIRALSVDEPDRIFEVISLP